MECPSIIKVLALYYLILLNPLSTNLISKSLKNYIEDNRMSQHLISVITLFVLINLLYGNKTDNSNIYLITAICYIFFVLTTKIEVQINMIIIFSLIVIYFYESIIENKNIQNDNDNVLSDEEKQRIKISRNKIKNISYVILASAVFLGIYFYSSKKTVQYGGGFSLTRFFFY